MSRMWRTRRAPLRRATVALAALLLLAACGSDSTSTSVATDDNPTMAGPTVTGAPRQTTTTSIAGNAPATTIIDATTTTEEPLPQPVNAPTDARADEPRVDLGTIEIPKINVTKPLLEGITLTTLDAGPGHWPGSAMPGKLGNVVVAGHRTSHDRPFRNLDKLAPGDEVIFTTADGRFVYKVVDTSIVTPDAMYIVSQTRAYTATLFACHPVGSTKERIVVHLQLA